MLPARHLAALKEPPNLVLLCSALLTGALALFTGAVVEDRAAFQSLIVATAENISCKQYSHTASSLSSFCREIAAELPHCSISPLAVAQAVDTCLQTSQLPPDLAKYCIDMGISILKSESDSRAITLRAALYDQLVNLDRKQQDKQRLHQHRLILEKTIDALLTLNSGNQHTFKQESVLAETLVNLSALLAEEREFERAQLYFHRLVNESAPDSITAFRLQQIVNAYLSLLSSADQAGQSRTLTMNTVHHEICQKLAILSCDAGEYLLATKLFSQTQTGAGSWNTKLAQQYMLAQLDCAVALANWQEANSILLASFRHQELTAEARHGFFTRLLTEPLLSEVGRLQGTALLDVGDHAPASAAQSEMAAINSSISEHRHQLEAALSWTLFSLQALVDPQIDVRCVLFSRAVTMAGQLPNKAGTRKVLHYIRAMNKSIPLPTFDYSNLLTRLANQLKSGRDPLDEDRELFASIHEEILQVATNKAAPLEMKARIEAIQQVLKSCTQAYNRAEIERAYRILSEVESIYGKEHDFTKSVVHSIVQCLVTHRQWPEARQTMDYHWDKPGSHRQPNTIDAQLYYWSGRAHMGAKNWALAKEELMRASQLFSTIPSLHYRRFQPTEVLGDIELQQHHYAQALSLLSEARRLYQSQHQIDDCFTLANIEMLLAAAYEGVGSYQLAKEIYMCSPAILTSSKTHSHFCAVLKAAQERVKTHLGRQP